MSKECTLIERPFQHSNLYFLFPRFFVYPCSDAGLFCKLDLPAKAIFPCIGRFMNAEGYCYPSIDTLCKTSGIKKRDSVVQALRTLKEGLIIEIGKTRNRNGGLLNIYQKGKRWLGLQDTDKGMDSTTFFPFHHEIIDGGNWRYASLAAKALYPVLRQRAGLYANEGISDISWDGWIDEDEFDEHLKARSWDILRKSHYDDINELSGEAGISRRSFFNAMGSLKEVGLVEEFPEVRGAWKVYLKPPIYFKRDYIKDELQQNPLEGENDYEKQVCRRVQKGN